MIRAAVVPDIPRLIEMGLRFIAETNYRDFIEPSSDALEALFRKMLKSDQEMIFVSHEGPAITGMIGVFIYKHPMSLKPVGAEAFWWAEPEHRGHGVELFDYAEAWLKVMGAKKSQMIAPNERVAKFYRRRGYAKLEEQYQKDL